MRAPIVLLAVVLFLAGCSSLKKDIDNINASDSASGNLESYIQGDLTTQFGRSVRSVSCTPYVSEVLPQDSASVTCVIRFTDGTSYSTPATITDPSGDPDIATYTYSFDDPPAVDITTAPLPGPTVTLAATSAASLFDAANLAPVIKKLTARFGSGDLIIQLALYPGELVAVIAGNNTEAYAVSVTAAGKLTVGAPAGFDGQRTGIEFSQFLPSVIQRLTDLIVSKGGVPLSRVARFVLTNSLPDSNSGWNIYLTSGSTRFQSLVLGDNPVEITPSGTHALP
jgi:hypothetical protein